MNQFIKSTTNSLTYILIFLSISNLVSSKSIIECFPLNKQLFFIENKGQMTDQNHQQRPDVIAMLCSNGFKFQIRNNGFSYEFLKPEIESKSFKGVKISSQRVDINFVNCNQKIEIIKSIPDGYSENFLGKNNNQNSILEVKRYQKIRLTNVWDSIDVEFITLNNLTNTLKYNFIIHPGGKLSDIQLLYSGLPIALKENRIQVETAYGKVSESIPKVYYDDQANEASPKVIYRIVNQVIKFATINHPQIDSSKTLVIDPLLIWSTYYGGSGQDYANAMLLDSGGNPIITGPTNSVNQIATKGTYKNVSYYSSDAFIAKFDKSTSKLLWGTYYGGNYEDAGLDLVLDKNQNIIFTGTTLSDSGISTSSGYKTTFSGHWQTDVFLAKLSNDGKKLIWGTYYGGDSSDVPTNITVDSLSNIYIGGNTQSQNKISTLNSFKPKISKDTNDAFVAKFSSDGKSLAWGTYFGDDSDDVCNKIAIDSKSNVIITGSTKSVNGISTSSTYKPKITSKFNNNDAFVSKLSNDGKSLLWGTYFGGTGNESGTAIKALKNDEIILIGNTESKSGIATSGSYQTDNAGYNDCFIAKFSSSADKLIVSTYYGGENEDYPNDFILGQGGDVFVVGATVSSTGIATTGAFQTKGGNSHSDVFLAHFDKNLSQLIWATYYGSIPVDDYASAVAIDKDKNIYVTGATLSSSGIATPKAYQTTQGGNNVFDAFLLKCNSFYSEIEPIAQYNSEANIYPNPVFGKYISLRLKNLSESISSVRLLDISGKQICYYSATDIKDNQIPLPHTLPEGIYLIQIISNSFATTNKLIYKN